MTYFPFKPFAWKRRTFCVSVCVGTSYHPRGDVRMTNACRVQTSIDQEFQKMPERSIISQVSPASLRFTRVLPAASHHLCICRRGGLYLPFL